MGYTTEELGLIDGLVIPCMVGKGVTESLRDSFLRVHCHIQEDALDASDLGYIRMALHLLLPSVAGDKDSQTNMVRALATTNRLIRAIG